MLNIAYLVGECAVGTHFYGYIVLCIDEFNGRCSAPLLVCYLRLAKEVDVELVFALEVLAHVYKRGEEGVVVGFEVEGAFFGQYVYDFAFVNQHCALSRPHYQFAGVLYLIGFRRIFVPQVLLFVGLPLYYGRQLVAEYIGYAHDVYI